MRGNKPGGGRCQVLNWTLFNWADWIVVGVVVLSTLASLWRGFAREALSLAGWVAAFVIANLAGVPAMAQSQIAVMASDAGFEVKHVRVTGTSRMDERQVYARALAHRDRPMPRVDIEALRAELLELPWVADARVSIQLPGTLAIDIVEREPHAVLEKPDRLMLIDASGAELEPISSEDASAMLRISGPGSARQVAQQLEVLYCKCEAYLLTNMLL